MNYFLDTSILILLQYNTISIGQHFTSIDTKIFIKTKKNKIQSTQTLQKTNTRTRNKITQLQQYYFISYEFRTYSKVFNPILRWV